MKNQIFTQCLVATIEEAALEKFGDHSKFSREAFKAYKNPAGAWRAIRNPRENGKARALYIEDLLCISDVLGINLSELIFRVEQRIKMGWTEPEAPARRETVGTPRHDEDAGKHPEKGAA